jgi:hypothetical protein
MRLEILQVEAGDDQDAGAAKPGADGGEQGQSVAVRAVIDFANAEIEVPSPGLATRVTAASGVPATTSWPRRSPWAGSGWTIRTAALMKTASLRQNFSAANGDFLSGPR